MPTIVERICGLLLLVTAGSLGAVLQNIHPRIYYGEDASPGEFPSIVSLQVENMHSCGATIFNSEWIISAAHCVVDADVSKLSVVAGTIDLRNNGSVHQVTAAIPHEGYDPNNYFINDIAVLKVTPQFLFDGVNIEAVTLPSSGEVFEENTAVISVGWGLTSDLVIPDILQKTNLFVDSTDDCYRRMDPVAMLCASDPNKDTSACTGDSGGPLYANEVEIGIVSWSSGGCGSRNSPMIYVNVSSYIEWIEQNTSA